MHANTKLKWTRRDGNTASNEQRKSKGKFGVTGCHCHSETVNADSLGGHTAHVNTSWANEHDNTNWVHCTCEQHLGTLHVSALAGHMNVTTLTGHISHVSTSWANEHDNTNWVHCTCQHPGTLQVSTPNTRAHCTCQH